MALQVQYADISWLAVVQGRYNTAGTRRCDRGRLAYRGWPGEAGMQLP